MTCPAGGAAPDAVDHRATPCAMEWMERKSMDSAGTGTGTGISGPIGEDVPRLVRRFLNLLELLLARNRQRGESIPL
jgi:hypothetical protein